MGIGDWAKDKFAKRKSTFNDAPTLRAAQARCLVKLELLLGFKIQCCGMKWEVHAEIKPFALACLN